MFLTKLASVLAPRTQAKRRVRSVALRMGEAGTGYRLVLGAVFLALDVVLFVSGHVLLWLRRDYYPVKAWNPLLLCAILYSIVPSALWVPVREVAGDDVFRADAVLWLITTANVVYGVGFVMVMYRLLFIVELEKNKVAYALASLKAYAQPPRRIAAPAVAAVTAGATIAATIVAVSTVAVETAGAAAAVGAVPGVAPQKNAPRSAHARSVMGAAAFQFLQRNLLLRLGALTGVVIGCNAVVTGVFLAADSSADWHSYHFSYWNLSIIPLLFPLALGQLLAVPMVLRLRAYHADAWGIADSLTGAARYTATLRIAWIVLNAAWPEVNNAYFDSGYCVYLSMRLVMLQFVIAPALRTYTTAQAPVGRRVSVLSGGGGGGGGRGGAANGGGGVGILGALALGRSSKVSDDGSSGEKARAAVGAASAANHNAQEAALAAARADPKLKRARTPEDSRAFHPTTTAMAQAAAQQTQALSQLQGISRVGPGSGGGVLSRRGMHASLLDHPFMRVLTTDEYYAKFLTYVESEFASENLLFWNAVNVYRAAATSSSAADVAPNASASPTGAGGGIAPVIHHAVSLYRTFIAPDAPLQVNLSDYNARPLMDVLKPYLHLPPQQHPQPLLSPRDGAASSPAIATSPSNAWHFSGALAAEVAAPVVGAAMLLPPSVNGGAGGGSGGAEPSGTVTALSIDVKTPDGASPTATRHASAGDGGGGRDWSALFDDAQFEIFCLMETDSFARFKLSALGKPLAQVWRVSFVHHAPVVALPPPPPAAASPPVVLGGTPSSPPRAFAPTPEPGATTSAALTPASDPVVELQPAATATTSTRTP